MRGAKEKETVKEEMQLAETRSTGDLLSLLASTERWEDFRDRSSTSFRDSSLTEEIMRRCREKGLSRAEVARASGISDLYLYQIFRGTRMPSRDRMLCLCIGLGLSGEESEDFLKGCGYAPLYVRHRRDSIILHGILHNETIEQVNENLYAQGEEPLLK